MIDLNNLVARTRAGYAREGGGEGQGRQLYLRTKRFASATSNINSGGSGGENSGSGNTVEGDEENQLGTVSASTAESSVASTGSNVVAERDRVCDIVEEGDDEHSDNICSICLCEIEDGDIVGDIPCGHNFHKDCLKVWLTKSNLCPFCRQANIASSSSPSPPSLAQEEQREQSGEGFVAVGSIR